LRGELRSEDSGTSSMRVIRVFGVKVSETSVTAAGSGDR